MYKVYGADNKKMLNMLILEILKDYSDEDHPLTQQEILKLLRTNYGIEKCDRRSVKANVESLISMGYEISTEKGYFLMERELEDEELRWLIDAVLFSKTLSETQARRLIDKLVGFGNKYFEAKVSHVSTTPGLPRTTNKQVMINVHEINDAIDCRKKISFRYCSYGLDFKLHDRGRDYIVNPYRMIAANGYYYLLSNMDKHDDIAYFRIDKITNVTILKEKVKRMKKVTGLDHGLNLPKHMAEHVYMFTGPSSTITMRCSMWMSDALVDWFGTDIHILEKDEKNKIMTVHLKCNLDAMYYWALQYGPSVEVLEPVSLREDLRQATKEMAEKYSK